LIPGQQKGGEVLMSWPEVVVTVVSFVVSAVLTVVLLKRSQE